MLLNFLFPIAGIGVVYVFVCLALLRWQNRFMFLPSSQLKKTPSDLHLGYEEVWIAIAEEKEPKNKPEKIHGWWISAGNDKQRDRKTVLFLHGNAFNIGANLQQAEVFHRLGLSVLIIDYRGYGQSQGKFPTETQMYADAEISLNYLAQQRNIPPSEVIVYGHSLGGAIAIELATKNPNLAALIIQGSFTSMRDMIEYDNIFTVFPVDLLLKHYFDSICKIDALQMPILFVHGESDHRVPARMSRTLYETAKTPIKDFYIVPEGDHDHIPEIGGEAYYHKLAEFMQTVREQATEKEKSIYPLQITNN